MRLFLPACLALIAICSSTLCRAASERPNIVFILTDDQGIWTLGCYGAKGIRTPNIDRIASSGMRFENAFCFTPVCSPSRATLWTGRIPSQHGIHEWIDRENTGPQARQMLDGERSLPAILSENGYVCGISGKWHLGYSARPQHGFSDWFVHPRGSGPFNNASMIDRGRESATSGYITDVITDRALAFLDRNSERPFFLAVHYTAPHAPWTGHPEELVAQHRSGPLPDFPREPPHPRLAHLKEHLGNRESMAQYAAAIEGVDAGVGRLLDRLGAHRLREKTLVVFTSDHGFHFGHHGLVGKGNCTEPRNMYDWSIRVPLLASQPGTVPPGAASRAFVTFLDVLPTLLEHAGLPRPEVNLPGRSFRASMIGAKQGKPKTVYGEYGKTRMIRTPEWKYIHRYPDGLRELYDLRIDPGERANLAKDPAHAGRIRELRRRLEAWFAKYVIPGRDGTKLGP